MNISKRMEEIQTRGLDRTRFPEGLKSTLASKYWHNPEFVLGMEYGALQILHELKKRKR